MTTSITSFLDAQVAAESNLRSTDVVRMNGQTLLDIVLSVPYGFGGGSVERVAGSRVVYGALPYGVFEFSAEPSSEASILDIQEWAMPRVKTD